MSLKGEALHTDASLSTVLFNDVLNIQLLQYFKSSRLYYYNIHLELGRDWFELCFFYWEVCLTNKCWLKTLGLMKDDGCVRPYSSVLKTVFKHTQHVSGYTHSRHVRASKIRTKQNLVQVKPQCHRETASKLQCYTHNRRKVAHFL